MLKTLNIKYISSKEITFYSININTILKNKFADIIFNHQKVRLFEEKYDLYFICNNTKYIIKSLSFIDIIQQKFKSQLLKSASNYLLINNKKSIFCYNTKNFFLPLIFSFLIPIMIDISFVLTFLLCVLLLIKLFLIYSSSERKIIYSKNNKIVSWAIIVPLYKEAHMVDKIYANLTKLNINNIKLNIYFTLEESDTETIKACDAIKVAKILIVPDSDKKIYSFKTKPRAVNYALNFINEDFFSIYDAEDEPDSMQLQEAKRALFSNKKIIACQSTLVVKNQNYLSYLFKLEYLCWFKGYLQSISNLNFAIPLGGTSVHFKTKEIKEIYAFDSYNVTEDADLGLRIYNHNYKTVLINSETLESLPNNIKDWIKQRSRWIKGFMQTFLVNLFKCKNKQSLFTVCFFIAPSFLVHHIYLLFIINSIFQKTEYYYNIFALSILSHITNIYLVSKLSSLNKYNLAKISLYYLFYYLLYLPSYLKALYEIVQKPYFWDKTEHK
jgi:cellulose synthase/poly-beta-1,6-N-acetylglucosamine synthase-like glycosyltransferase